MKKIGQHIVILFLTGCSCFSQEKPAAPVVQHKTPPPVIKTSAPESCEQSCADKGGLKKTFCMKKCQSKQHKQDKQDKQALLQKSNPAEKKPNSSSKH
jgi:hypothetical protein